MSENNNTESKTRKYDDDQVKAIESNYNCVVAAGAGSGKTHVLSARYLQLIENGLHPGQEIGVDEILTLTFTKKATTEMYSRIYSTLQKKGLEGSAKAKTAAENFDKSAIMTLDSYCSQVAKLGSRYYGVTPKFTQDQESLESNLNQLSLPFILKHKNNPAIQEIAQSHSLQEISSDLFSKTMLHSSRISRPLDFKAALRKQIEFIMEDWNSNISTLESSWNRLVEFVQGYTKGGATIEKWNKAIEDFNPEFLEMTPEIVEADFGTRDAFSQNHTKYNELVSFMNAVSKIGQHIKDDEFKSDHNQFKEFSSSLVDDLNFFCGLHISRELVPLLEEFQEMTNSFKRTSGILTFGDISQMALDILINYPEIRQLEKSKYKAIMIDEFQDNNQQQRDMLFLLAEKLERNEKSVPLSADELEKDKLFFVGDEKQSIYLFRGADVSVFQGLRNTFREGNLDLQTNYRSHPALIESFNTMFGGFPYPSSDDGNTKPSIMFTQLNEDLRNLPDYEAVYHKVLVPQSKTDGKSMQELYQPRTFIAMADPDTEPQDENFATKTQAESIWVANKIKELTTAGYNGRIYDYNEIAILFKTYSEQTVFERTFLDHQIPYNLEVITGFFSDGPTNDIISLLRTYAYPKDTLAYTQLLTSPFLNLSLSKAQTIVAQNQGVLEADISEILDETETAKWIQFREFYASLKEQVLTGSIAKTITKIWYESGYRMETLWNLKVKMFENLYDRLFEMARSADLNNTGLADFVDSLRNLRPDNEKVKDLEIPLEKENSVNLLSIHKSKGLEYPVVFVVNVNKGKIPDHNKTPIFSSPEYGPVINTPSPSAVFGGSNTFYRYMKKLRDNKELAELKRVAYVGFTRAEELLFITGVTPSKKNQSIYTLMEPLIDFYSQDENKQASPFILEEIPPQPKETEQTVKNTRDGKAEFIQTFQEAVENASEIHKDVPEKLYINPSKLHEKDDDMMLMKSKSVKPAKECKYTEINAIVEKSNFTYADFGTIAHAFMEGLINDSTPLIKMKNITALPEDKFRKMVEDACTNMQNDFKNNILGKMAMNSENKKAETEFRCKFGNKILKGTIDLYFENDDGTFTIVDYKTDMEINPEIHVLQLASYRYALSRLRKIDMDKINCHLYYLRYDQDVDITEDCRSVDLVQELKQIPEDEVQFEI